MLEMKTSMYHIKNTMGRISKKLDIAEKKVSKKKKDIATLQNET